MGHPGRLREVEERAGVGPGRRAVVEQQGDSGAQRGHQPVPHHPPAGGEVHQPIARTEIAVQAMLLQVLEQGAAVTVDDALGRSGGAGGVHHEERMVEGQRLEGDRGRSKIRDEVLPEHGARRRSELRRRGRVGDDHDPLDGGDPVDDLREPGQGVVALAVEEVAVHAEEHAGRDLTEAVHDALHPEVRRARGPQRADGCAREHGDEGLGQVGKVPRHPVSRPDAGGAKRLREHRDPIVELTEAELRVDPVLAAKHERARLVPPSQQVLRVVEARLGKPSRAGHALAVAEHLLAPPRGHHPRKVPHLAPERGRLVDRPAVQGAVIADRNAVALAHLARETGDIGARDAFLGRAPQRLAHRLFPRLVRFTDTRPVRVDIPARRVL